MSEAAKSNQRNWLRIVGLALLLVLLVRLDLDLILRTISEVSAHFP
jgi:hypothetical protein